MFPPGQFSAKGPLSPGALGVPPAPLGINTVIQPTSSNSSPPGLPSGTPGRLPIMIPIQWFQPAAELLKNNIAEITDFPTSLEISCKKLDVDDVSDNSSDSSGVECNAPFTLKHNKFSLKQFAKRMGLPNYSLINNWKKVRETGFLETKHLDIIWGQNCMNQLQDEPLHWVTAIEDSWATFKKWLPLEYFNLTEWIQRQWVEMYLTTCTSNIRWLRTKGRWGS